MKTMRLIACFLLSAGLQAQAQQYCGFDASREWCMDHIPGYAEKITGSEALIRHAVEYGNFQHGNGQVYTVPVAVHIIHQNGPENISDEQVEQALEWLNDAYANTGFYASVDGVDFPIRFCLAHVDPDGEFSSGITRVASPLTSVTIPTQDLDLKDLSRWDPYSYMNIWVVSELIREVDNTSIIGNSSLPGLHGTDYDGVIIEATFFGVSENSNKAFIHEVGHYLGLYHTFEGGCTNDDCLEDGDKVCDTPPDGIGSAQSCLNGNNSCTTDEDDVSDNNPFRPVGLGGLGDQPDMQQNYMDYSSLTCYEFFTPGQSDRCLAALLNIRFSLLEGNRCNPPCTTSIVADVTASTDTLFLGESVFFSNNSLNTDATDWYVNETVVATTSDFQFTPSETGNYFIEVLLQNDEPGCNVELEFSIEVLCPSIASFSTDGQNILQNVTTPVTNTSQNATSYSWIVDGDPFSIQQDIELVFSEFGTHEVCLIANGPLCSSTHCQLFSVGNCATGNENRHWVTYTGENSINQYYFTGQETLFTTEVIEYSENKSTISDENGLLLFSTNGEQLFDKNLNLTPNGDALSGGLSSRSGSMFVKAPGSDTEYYLFYSDMNENNFADGIRYSLIDRTLNNGLGDIVPGVKNIFISSPHTEALTAIRHCNYEDFWLLYYSVTNQRFEVYLVNSEGIAADPVVYDYPSSNFTSGTGYYFDIRVSPQGNLFVHNNTLFSFDGSNGDIEVYHQFSFFEVTFYDFSITGKYLYIQSQSENVQIFLHQVDMTLPPDEMESAMFSMAQPLFAIYSDIQRTTNGEIYMSAVFSGAIDVIHNPELSGLEMDIEYGAIDNAGFVNSFGNYFHAYTQAPLFIEGITKVCEKTATSYSLFGCAEGDITWSTLPAASLSLPGDGSAEIEFPGPGVYQVNAVLETSCGMLNGSVQVVVTDGVEPELGADMHICAGSSVILDPGQDFVSYAWNTGAFTSTLSTSMPGTYSVTTEDASGCTYSDSIELLEVIAGTIDLGPDFEYCDSTVVVLDAGNDFLDYTWQDGTTGPLFTVFEAGVYTVTATQPCDATDSIVVEGCHDAVPEQSTGYIVVFPNPSQGIATISYAGFHDHCRVLVNDATGRLIYSYQGAMVHRHDLDVSQWQQGLYTVSLVWNTHTFHTKMVVMHE